MELQRIRPDNLETLGKAKGAYIVALRLAAPVDVSLKGKMATRLAPGWYLYAGSAYGGGGIRSRLRRHFLGHKKIHWHIDRLTTEAAEIVAFADPDGNECVLVECLMQTGRYLHIIPGFGSSDCQTCESHLLMAQMSVAENGFDTLDL